jgi:hypothetical protein
MEWEQVVALGVHGFVERIEAAHGLPFAGKRPTTTRRVLTYRTVSRLVNNAAFNTRQHEASGIEVEPCHWDSSWEDAPAAWVSDFPAVSDRVEQGTCPHHIWHVGGGGISIALDARSAEAWSRNGEHLDLSASYSFAGRNFDVYIERIEELAANCERSEADETPLLVGTNWGPCQEGDETPFTYQASYDRPDWNRGLFEDPMFRLDISNLLKQTRQAFSITFAGECGIPIWISGNASRGRLALETGYGVPGELRKPKRGGAKALRELGWKSPADPNLGGFTAVLSDSEIERAVDLILRTLQSSAYGQLHTIWWVRPPSLSAVVARAQDQRVRPLA